MATIDDAPFWALTVGLAALLGAASELGWRIGRRDPSDSTERRAHTNVLLGSVLALLGLMLAFSRRAARPVAERADRPAR